MTAIRRPSVHVDSLATEPMRRSISVDTRSNSITEETMYETMDKKDEEFELDERPTPNQTESPIAQAEHQAPASPKYSNARLIALVITVTGAAFLNTIGVQAAVIVLPSIGKDLNIPDARQQWIVSSYSLTFGCFLLLFGRLADVYGKRLVFLWGSAWLTAVTAALPFIPSEIGFDTFRGLQGLGAAATVPTAIGILGVTFPPGKSKAFAFSSYGAGAPLGATLGNILGGFVGGAVSWRAIWWILSGLAGTVTLAGFFIIPLPPASDKRPSVHREVDWIGGTLITTGLLALMFALTEGNIVGWSTPWVPVLIVVSLIVIAAFMAWQWYLEMRTTRKPLMKMSIFKNIRFSAAMLIAAFFFSAFSNYLIYATFFYQDYLGLSIIQTTYRFLPTGVVGLITIFTTAHLLRLVRATYLLIFGAISVSLSNLLFAVPIPPSTTYWAYGFPAMCVCVFGADTMYPTLTLFTAISLPQENQAMGGAMINAVNQVGRAIGLAVATAIQTAVTASERGEEAQAAGKASSALGDPAFLAGLRAAQWISFAYAIVALALVMGAFRGAGKLGKTIRR